jgi:transposase
MRNAAARFKDRNGLWTAHKLRNRIAHETDVVVGYNEARYALASYKKALKDLGAI